MHVINRRQMVQGAAALMGSAALPLAAWAQSAEDRSIYGAVEGEPYPVPAINLSRISKKHASQL